MAAVLAMAAVGILLIGPAGASGPGGPKEAGVVTAGEFEFAYPKSWERMSADVLKSTDAADAAGPGELVAGLCTEESAKGACGSNLDVSYVVFKEGTNGVPSLSTLEASMDRDLPASFAAFDKKAAELRRTEDGSQYFAYEFTYRAKGDQRTELLAAYRREGAGLLVVATGPSADYAGHRSDLLKMLDGAVAASE